VNPDIDRKSANLPWEGIDVYPYIMKRRAGLDSLQAVAKEQASVRNWSPAGTDALLR
jgi:hypothetical protein